MKKITVVGAGNVGATCVNEVARMQLAEQVVVVDLNEGAANGKALDLWETSPIQGFSTRLVGAGNDYSHTKGSEIVVITAGLPRKPGMSRDDLIGTNAKIMKTVAENLVAQSPEAIFIVVTNPLDVMTYACLLASKRPTQKVFGMAGILDTARYRSFIAEALNVAPRDIQAMLMGGHGDTMVPLPRYTTVSGIPVSELMPADKLEAIIERTKKGGGEIVNMMGTSAWYAPGAAAAEMVASIARNERRILPVCAHLDGQYGLSGLHLGVPVILGENGVEQVLELQLNDEEMALLHKSADHVRGVMETLDGMKLFA
ncbi:MAG: malate dehydrogenase [Bacteroidetes bacterium]|nr:MAG: malate dehydrogenase [Bacteroidota bacterium]